jgi:hypothetical protein
MKAFTSLASIKMIMLKNMAKSTKLRKRRYKLAEKIQELRTKNAFEKLRLLKIK